MRNSLANTFSRYIPPFVASILIGVFVYLVYGEGGYDDPYITYRYAENLYAGLGFVYNAGERVLSTTTPLFALILAGVRLLWSNLPQAANLIGVASLTAGALFLWDIAKGWDKPVAGWAALVLYPTFGLLVRTLGSETPFYLALCLAAIAFYLRNKITITATLLALATLTRGDAVILAVVLAIDWLIKHPLNSLKDLRALPWTGTAIGAGILIAWTVFAVPYFGSPLPVTLAAKRGQGLMEISEDFLPGFFVILHPYTQIIYFWVELIFLAIGIVYVIWQERPWLLLLGWAVVYFIAYSLLGVTRYFWYYAPLVPAIVGMIGLGLEAVKECIPPARAGRRFLAWASILTLAGLAIAQGIHLFQIRDNLDPRLTAYRMVGEWLSQNTSPTVAIGTLEVGVIGYYASPRPIIDFAGLIQPEVADLFAPQITYQNTAIWAITMYKPRILVLYSGSFPYLEQTFVADNCTRAKKFPGKETGYSQDLIIYKCQYP
ncbi:MAG TPA: hypothetical protein VI451_16880 [Anaerolineales bacterium]|nr:hypothetical protein [Anaerolineales bacterium]